ncbi:MAG: YdcF family protein [Clostridiaceae bacterium]
MDNRIITDITNYIFVSDKPQKVDIIFLPGGSFPEIPERAAKLYHDGYAPLLLPSGGVSVKSGKFNGAKSKIDIYDKEYKTDCQFYTDVLLKNGVPRDSIICEDKSGHTRDNAFMSRKVIDEKGFVIKKAVICCKSFHARRCLMLYQLAFPEAEIYVVPVDCYGITHVNWYIQEYGIDRVLGELARCGNQFVGDIKEYLKCQK